MTIDLDKLEAALAKATPGPWDVSSDDAKDTHTHADSGLARVDSTAPPVRRFKNGSPVPHWPVARLCEWPEAELIVAAVNALPALIARIREQDKVIAAADAMRADAERWLNLLRGYRKMVNAVAPHFDKPITDDNVVLWLNLNNAGATVDAALDAAREGSQ